MSEDQKNVAQFPPPPGAEVPEPTHVLVPSATFAQARAVIGSLPHDQVAGLCSALANCQGVTDPVFREAPEK